MYLDECLCDCVWRDFLSSVSVLEGHPIQFVFEVEGIPVSVCLWWMDLFSSASVIQSSLLLMIVRNHECDQCLHMDEYHSKDVSEGKQ